MAAVASSDRAVGLLRDWGWTGFPGGIIHDVNALGAILCLDQSAHVWIINPADLEAYQISGMPFQLDQIWDDPEFQDDWQRAHIVQRVAAHLGPLAAGQIYAMQIPLSLGGDEDVSNYRVEEAAAYSTRMGTLAEKLHAAGDGCEVDIDESGDGPPVIEPVI